MISAKIDSVDRIVALAIRDTLSPAARSTAFAAFARKEIAEAARHNVRILGGPQPRPEILVDGRRGAALESVKPEGVIRAEFAAPIGMIVREILAMLHTASPVVSGDYRRSHRLFINGVKQRSIPPDFAEGDDIAVGPTVPYARRLEVGRTESGRAFSLQVPPRIVERTGKVAARRFGRLARISVEYRAIGGGRSANRSPQITIKVR